MADIKERIANVGQFFKGMQVTKVDDTDVIYVIVSFPPRWLIDDAVTEKFDVNVMDGNEPGEHLFCAEMSTGFDKVFDAVDHCVRENREAMERAQLFQEKINLFYSQSLRNLLLNLRRFYSLSRIANDFSAFQEINKK